MGLNWITLITVFLLISPLLIGLIRGLPHELEKMKYTVHSVFSSIVWILSYVIAFWGLHTVITQNWDISQLQWFQQQLKATIFAWVIALPISAMIISWFIGLLTRPLVELLMGSVHQLRGFSSKLPKGLSNLLTVCLKIPKAVLHTLLFLLAIHFGLAYIQSPALAQTAASSSVFQWADSSVINPLLSSSLTKNLPVLGRQAGNWFDQISKEAAKVGPKDSRSFWTWQTRFDSNAQIDSTARSIVKGAKTDREKAYRLYKWIGQHIQYDDSKAMAIESGQFRSLTYGAIPTFQSRKGICSDYSALMVAMGKAVGLDVKQQLGEAVLPDGGGGPHAWNVVYLKDEHKSIPVDPTWERTGDFFDNADFYVTHRPDNSIL